MDDVAETARHAAMVRALGAHARRRLVAVDRERKAGGAAPAAMVEAPRHV